jgi:hypothetical protein
VRRKKKGGKGKEKKVKIKCDKISISGMDKARIDQAYFQVVDLDQTIRGHDLELSEVL